MIEVKNGTDWSRLKDAGLFREGIHFETNITAITPEGETIEIDVFPIHVDEEKNTLFAPLPTEALKMNKVIQKTPRNYL